MGAPGHALEDSRVESKACKTDGLDKDRRGKIDFSEGRHCGSSLDMGIIIHSKRHKRRFCRDTYSLSPSARKKFYPSSLAESHQLAEKASIVLLKSTVSKNSCVYYWVVEFVEEEPRSSGRKCQAHLRPSNRKPLYFCRYSSFISTLRLIWFHLYIAT